MNFRKVIWFLVVGMVFITIQCDAQQMPWHGLERTVHYLPQNNGFTAVNGKGRFNRALYGSNSGFRVETGDVPEFALYMPGMGGNLRFAIVDDKQHQLFLDHMSHIEMLYSAGAMRYIISDTFLQKASITLEVRALMEGEGIIIKMLAGELPENYKLKIYYGGASGKRFSRDGDIGADPASSFDLKPEYCEDNVYQVKENSFVVHFKIKNEKTSLTGIFPKATALSQDFFESYTQPYLVGLSALKAHQEDYFYIGNREDIKDETQLKSLFEKTESLRLTLAGRVTLHTPDSFINVLGSTLAMAADAIYEYPGYLHGAVAWRMRLNAWRGAYVADPLGWHDRARSHFESYAKSQLTEPPTGPVIADTALGMARQLEKLGTSLFSDGYICRNPNGDFRPHHYDMNLVFIDQLLNHFNWTGDTAFVRNMWPLIKRHLAWEKRNFDADNDGLYDAYACIWASDALQYNGGAVLHASAYNLRANEMAARIAGILNEDIAPFKKEAEKIHNAIRFVLWLPHLGSFAEYKDNTASCNLHAAAGLWTIYHALDEGIADAFQSYESLQYVDHDIPHIPVIAKGLRDTGLFVLSTTNWQPYTWSVNNVALAENLHTALAYWQGGRNNTAFTLWKSALMESMLLSTSPGNFGQLSFYDAMRGELYRDFADPIGMAGRTLVEGLFGVRPDLLNGTVTIQPGFPESWQYASLHIPDADIDFKSQGKTDTYLCDCRFANQDTLKLIVPMKFEEIATVVVDGKVVKYAVEPAIGKPLLSVAVKSSKQNKIVIQWKGDKWKMEATALKLPHNSMVQWNTHHAILLECRDSQRILSNVRLNAKGFSAIADKGNDYGTVFLKLKRKNMEWWEPLDFSFDAKVKDTAAIVFESCQPLKLSAYFNAKVADVFEQQYMSPRSSYPTLQLPVQGIGNWCYPKVKPVIDDAGFRLKAAKDNAYRLNVKLWFETPTTAMTNNIVYTSLWDNYLDSVVVPVNGNGRYLSFLMCGTTNPMQSQMENGRVEVVYTDGSRDNLILKNPDNWWPVEQDYIEDGYAFHLKSPLPERIHLKSGIAYNGFAPDSMYTQLKGFSNRMIDGGAATVLYLKINPDKQLKSLILKATASEVVIGLMAVSILK